LSARPPTPTLVIDTNILLSMALGRRETAHLLEAGVFTRRRIVASSRTIEELGKVYRTLRREDPFRDNWVQRLLQSVAVLPEDEYAHRMGEAAASLRLAVPSRNGSTTDAHVLALAWTVGADVWSADRDFAGTGWPSWSSTNLIRALPPP